MFKEILRVILDELKMESFELGGLTFSRLGMVKPSGCGYIYRLVFYANEQCISVDFDEDDCDIFVETYEVADKYISISSKSSSMVFFKEISNDNYIRLDLENSTIESLVRNNIKFHIVSKSSEKVLLSVNYNNNFKLTKIKDYILIGNSDNSNSAFEVFIPDDSEIRIYL